MLNLMEKSVHVVILGGGFGGIYAGLELEKIIADPGGMKLTMISRENFFVFTPMLHEVSSGSIATRHITIPIRKIYRKCDFREAEIASIDLSNRKIVTRSGSHHHGRIQTLEYTHLLIALGGVTNFFGLEAVERHALTLKSISDAIVLRNHIIDMLEQSELAPPEEQEGLLTIVVAGAGFAGTELVAELNDFIHEAAGHYKHVRRELIKVVLVDPGSRILPELSEDLGEFALSKLRAQGIEVVLRTRVVDASDSEVVLDNGRTIRTRSLIWTAGVSPSPLVQALSCAHDQRGRVLTNEYLEVLDFKNVWAIGDCAAIPDSRSGKTYPPTAQHAIRQGRLVAHNIVSAVMGGRRRAFIYDLQGQLASLGQRSGVANLFGIKFSGFVAWWLWRTIYLFKLPQLDRKVRVALDWTLDLIFSRDIVKLTTFSPNFYLQPEQALPSAAPTLRQERDKDRTSEAPSSAGTRDFISSKTSQVVEVPTEHSVPESRRSFLGLLMTGMAAAMTGILGYVFAGFSLWPRFRRRPGGKEWIDVVQAVDIPEGEPIKKSVVVSQDGGWGRFNSQQLVWIVKNGASLVVYSAICPHLGCTVNAAESGFICPCHGSAWNRDGEKIGGPAPRRLDTLEYRVESGMLQVKYRYFKPGVAAKHVIA